MQHEHSDLSHPESSFGSGGGSLRSSAPLVQNPGSEAQIKTIRPLVSAPVMTEPHPLSDTGFSEGSMELPSVDSSSTRVIPGPRIAAPSNTAATQFPATSLFVPKITTLAVSPPRTLQDMADAFMAGPSQRNSDGQSPPLLHPPGEQLPPDASSLDRLRWSKNRRAWADVVTIATQMLHQNHASDSASASNSVYATLYTALLHNTVRDLPSLESHQQELVEIVMTMLQGLLALGRTVDLSNELERWSFCHHLDGTAPDWIPWSLHIAAAASLVHAAPVGSKESSAPLDALVAIRGDIPVDDVDAILEAEFAISNTLLSQSKWNSAIKSLQRMIDLLPASTEKEADRMKEKGCASILECAYRCELLSRQGRILLQTGALEGASDAFQEAATSWEGVGAVPAVLREHVVVATAPAQLAINEGLLCFSYSKYEEALEFFRKAVQSIRESQILDVSIRSTSNWFGDSSLQALYSEAINNMSVCALYTCRLEEALSMMESLVRENPTSYLTDRVALNLCTLYELASDSAGANRRKRTLLTIAKRYSLHDVREECFRLN